jgi:tRNA dimethylallyltransferase
MFEEGLVNEVRELYARYGSLSRTAAQAVGYREVRELLDGQRDLQGTVEAVKARTRQFARRQETWFRQMSECRRIHVTEADTPTEIAERIVSTAALRADSQPD